MSGTHSPADLALLAELRALLDRLDPVPDAVYAAAYRAVVLIGSERDAEPLELVADSTLDSAYAGVRGSSEP
ncbi:MAG: hypothetical protein ACRDQ5_24680 [Sciscionella sp.]